jgi:hypothetical protein
MNHLRISFAWIALLVALTGCQSAYYGAMEKAGYHKRDIMRDRVENVRDAQEDSKQEFQSALEAFQSMFGKQSTDLQKQYDVLNSAFKDAKDSADEVSVRIGKVESVSEALFDEWEDEIKLYSSARLKADSQAKLKQTKTSYKQLIAAMHKAESRAMPVLAVFQDQVLYLKHNLNAQAINGLQSELKNIERDVGSLIGDMEKSIAEAQAFIVQIQG